MDDFVIMVSRQVIRVWDLTTNETRAVLEAPPAEVWGIAFDPCKEGARFIAAAGGASECANIFSLESKEKTAMLQLPPAVQRPSLGSHQTLRDPSRSTHQKRFRILHLRWSSFRSLLCLSRPCRAASSNCSTEGPAFYLPQPTIQRCLRRLAFKWKDILRQTVTATSCGSKQNEACRSRGLAGRRRELLARARVVRR